jgi:hypothetical protein
VTTETLETRAKELGVLYMETSAKAGHNVKNLFKKIALALPGANAEGAGEGTTTSEYHDGVPLPYTRRDGDWSRRSCRDRCRQLCTARGTAGIGMFVLSRVVKGDKVRAQ